MAYDDYLFQLGMGCTSKPAVPVPTSAKKFSNSAALTPAKLPVQPTEDRKDFFIERDGVRYAGNHLLIDVFGASRLDDLKHIEQTLKRCVEVAGATLLHIHLHHFTPNGGVSGVAVLSESHISIHSWPEANYAALDVFMCGEAKPELCVDILREEFQARDVVVKPFKRGEEMDRLAWEQAATETAPPTRHSHTASRSR